MNVLLDAHMVGEQETGNETYIVNLSRGLVDVHGTDTFIVAAAHPEEVAPIVAGDSRFTVVPVSANPFRRLCWDLPRLASAYRPAVLYVSYAGPVITSCPMAVAVHDVSYKRHPAWFSPRDRVVLNTGVGMTVRRARAVITLSEFSRREIVRFYPAASARVHAVHLAPGQEFVATGQYADQEVRARLGIETPYILAVGSLQPRKNLVRLLHAFASLANRADFRHRLVFTGKVAWQGEDVDAEMVRLGLASRVIRTGYVPPTDLPALYRGADVFVYPSLYEGFGLPVLEAMACGTPVIASSTSAVAEVAGDAARLVDPLSTEDLAAAIDELCVSPDERRRYREKGLARSREFSWTRTAARTMEILRLAANQPAGQRTTAS